MLVAIFGLTVTAVLQGKDGAQLDENMKPSRVARYGRTVGIKTHGSGEWMTVLRSGDRVPATEAATRRYEGAPLAGGGSDVGR